MSRGTETFQEAGVRIGAVGCVALVAGVVLGWAPLIPVAAALAGGLYAAELVLADAPLDVAAPAVATGLLLCTELGYWSLEERTRWLGQAGEGFRRAAFVSLLGVATFLVATVLLAAVDAVRAQGLALDLLGAVAAAAALAIVLLVSRGPGRASE